MLDADTCVQTVQTAAATTGDFTAIENGVGGSGSVTGSGLGVSDQQRLSRQVSLRVRRKKLVRRVAAKETWLDAADKIRVSVQIGCVLSIFDLV